jgi:threonyl-tRNA synthetase
MEFKFKDQEAFWHSSAHLMAQAVLAIWSEIKPTIGPAIEMGFYYDFYKKEPFKPEDLVKIEKKMEELVQKNLKIERKELTIEEVRRQINKDFYTMRFEFVILPKALKYLNYRKGGNI